MRKDKVSRPSRNIQLLSGEMHDPRFLRGTVLMRRMNARGKSGAGRSTPHLRPP